MIEAEHPEICAADEEEVKFLESARTLLRTEYAEAKRRIEAEDTRTKIPQYERP
jgi:hypothetical protein